MEGREEKIVRDKMVVENLKSKDCQITYIKLQ